ncbi:MAG: hypothetical protein LBC71_04745 [Oscillospiraceae bacterium]|jgi:hypothetical protein|nr:hypothetical protein [Oscillospiraceae bacterium]
MWIWSVLLLLVPALVSILLFERFRGYEFTLIKRIIALPIFAFLVNMAVYAVLFVRGWAFFSWSGGADSSLTNTSAVLQYMIMALAIGVVLAYILSMVKISKKEDKPNEDEENNENNPE